MTLNFQTTFEDFKEARSAHSAARRGRRWTSGLLLLCLAGVVVILTVTTRHTPPPVPVAAIAVAGKSAATARQLPPPPGASMVESVMPTMPCLLIFIAMIRWMIGQFRRPRGRLIDVTRVPVWQALLDRYIPAVLVVSGLFAIAWRVMTDDTGTGRAMEILRPGLPWAITVLFLWTMFFRRLPRRLWKANPSLDRPKTVTADRDRFILSDELTTLVYQWPAVIRSVETPGQFLIYTSEFAYHVVPRRAFGDQAEVDEFRSMVDEWEGSRTGGFPVIPVAVAKPVLPIAA